MGRNWLSKLDPIVVAVRTAMAVMTAGIGNESAGVGWLSNWFTAGLGGGVGYGRNAQRSEGEASVAQLRWSSMDGGGLVSWSVSGSVAIRPHGREAAAGGGQGDMVMARWGLAVSIGSHAEVGGDVGKVNQGGVGSDSGGEENVGVLGGNFVNKI